MKGDEPYTGRFRGAVGKGHIFSVSWVATCMYHKISLSTAKLAGRVFRAACRERKEPVREVLSVFGQSFPVSSDVPVFITRLTHHGGVCLRVLFLQRPFQRCVG